MTGPGARLAYEVVDVFTAAPFAGNPLAVVHGADGLPDAALQAVAREFNLSETAFPLPPTRPGADYRVRIFTPSAELPFAGHPSVGTAWVLARSGAIRTGEVVQECGAGLLPVVVDADGAALTGGAPSLGPSAEPGPLLAAAGLGPDDVDGARAPGRAGCGIDFTVLAVRADAVARAVVDPPALRALGVGTGLLLVALDTSTDPLGVHARMFAPDVGVAEDPATGSAALALGVWLADRGAVPADGTARYRVRQGAEIGRPSTLDCTVTAAGGAATATTVRGSVVPVAEGSLRPPVSA